MAQLNVCLKKFVWMLCAPEMLETGDACRDHATGHRETVEVRVAAVGVERAPSGGWV